MRFTTHNPATGRPLTDYDTLDEAGRDRLLDQAHEAARQAARTSPRRRTALLRQVGATLRERRAELAALATAEMGKPITEALAEVEKCAAACDHFAEHAPAVLADEPHPSNATESYVSYLPLGVVLAIMPWNYPYWQVFRHAAPAVMAGNTVVVKHAENTLGVAAALAEVFAAAGAPAGTFTSLVATTDEVAQVIADDRIAAVTLTGSTRAGATVAALAGGVWKKTVLELGGSDAFVVLEDADVQAAATTAVTARFQNCGQSCIAAKRFIVVESVARQFTDALVEGVRALRRGDPRDADTTLGPMARGDLRDQLSRQLAQSRDGAATVLLEGGPVDGPGCYFDPVVLAVRDRSLPVWREETFGPIAPVLVVASQAQALEVANDSDYGLGGNVWTADLDRGKAFARQLRTGAVFVNGMTASDPRLPFGGVKHSGYGRELAPVGIREFTNQQTVWVGPASG